MAGGGCVRGQADILGVDAVEQVGHGGVGGHGDVGDLRHRELMFLQEPVHYLVDGGGHRALQLLQPLLLLAEDHAGDDVVPVTHLGIVIRGVPDDLAGGQVQELDPDGGGADVHGEGKVALGGVAGLHLHNPGFPGAPLGKVQGGGDPEVVLAHHLGQLAQHEEIGARLSRPCWRARPCSRRAQIADVVRQGRRRQSTNFF